MMHIWAKIPHPYTAKWTNSCPEVNQISWSQFILRLIIPFVSTRGMYYVSLHVMQSLPSSSPMSVTENSYYQETFGANYNKCINGNNYNGHFLHLSLVSSSLPLKWLMKCEMFKAKFCVATLRCVFGLASLLKLIESQITMRYQLMQTVTVPNIVFVLNQFQQEIKHNMDKHLTHKIRPTSNVLSSFTDRARTKYRKF